MVPQHLFLSHSNPFLTVTLVVNVSVVAMWTVHRSCFGFQKCPDFEISELGQIYRVPWDIMALKVSSGGKWHLLINSSHKSVNLVWLLNLSVTTNLDATQAVWISLRSDPNIIDFLAALCRVLLQCGLVCVRCSLTWCSTLFFPFRLKIS